MLRVARWTTVVSGAAGVALAIALGSVVDALTIFYTLLGVSPVRPDRRRAVRAPDVGARRAGVDGGGRRRALALHVATGGRGWGPSAAIAGLAAAAGPRG